MTALNSHRFRSHYRHLDVEIEAQQCELPGDELTRLQEELRLLADELFQFPASELRISIVYHPRREEYHAQAWLKLPGKRIVSGRYSPWLDYSVMRCLAQISRHAEWYMENLGPGAAEQMQHQHELQNRVVPPTEHVADALGKAIERQDYRAFRRALSGYEDWVRPHVANWVRRYPQMTPLLGKRFDIEDLVEETFLMAFEHFHERPEEKTISEWILGFIDPAVRAVWQDPAEREAASYARTFGTTMIP